MLRISMGDPRVANWLFMDNPAPTVFFIILYLLFVFFGQWWMENRKPFELKWVRVVYNAVIICLSGYMFVEILYLSIASHYNYGCTPVDYSNDPLALRMAAVLWWFYFSKFIEFTDTILMVLRKKKDQITFLHVYHHVSMFFFWWMGIKWVPGGQSFFAAMINSGVHFIMYYYYLISTLGKTVWWKKHLTQLQLIQFVILMFYAIYSLSVDCRFPHWMHWALLAYLCSLIVLFLNFYIWSYVCPKKKTKAKKNPKDKSDRIKRN